MRVDHHSFSLPKPGTKNDVGRLARCTWDGEQPLHFIWNFAAEFVDDLLRGADDRLRFIAKEPSRANLRLKLLGLQRREVFSRWIFLEQPGRDHVDAHIRALR